MPTTWDTDWDCFSAANHSFCTLDPTPCWIHEVSIVTYALSLIDLSPFHASVAWALFLDRILPSIMLRHLSNEILRKWNPGKNLWVVHVTAMLLVLYYLVAQILCAVCLYCFIVCSVVCHSLHHHSCHDCKCCVRVTAVFTTLFCQHCCFSRFLQSSVIRLSTTKLDKLLVHCAVAWMSLSYRPCINSRICKP